MPEMNVNRLRQTEYIRENTWKDRTFFVVARRFVQNKSALLGLTIILVLILSAIFAPVLATHSPTKVDPIHAYELPSAGHLLGTDDLGRDIFSRILYGAKYSLAVGIGAELLGALIGIIFGAVAGYFGGVVEEVILRICDVIQDIPNTLLCICVSQALGSGFFPTMIALSIGTIPGTIRMLRATMLSLREQEFIEASRAINCSSARIMFRHLVPNCLAPLLINMSNGVGQKIMGSAALSFLGLGIQDPTPEWGAMISAGKDYLRYHPHLVIIPGCFVAATVLAFNLIGDGLRDALDPKLRS